MLTALMTGAKLLGGYQKRKAAKRASRQAREIAQMGYDKALELGREAADMGQFKEFGVRSGLGDASVDATGTTSLELSPEQQQLQNMLLGQASGLFAGVGQDPLTSLLKEQTLQSYQGLAPSDLTGRGVSAYQGLGQDPMQQEILAQARERFAGVGQDPRQQALLSQADTAFGQAFADPTQARADVYEQLRATQRPEEERQALALEERMLAQGRLGMSSNAYGGATPEMLAQAKAREEAMATAGLRARQQVGQEQQQAYAQGLGLLGQASGMRAQDLAEATGLLGAGYIPEQRELARAGALFGAGMAQEQADLARAGTLQQASYMPSTQDLAMAQSMMNMGYVPQQQLMNQLGLGLKGAGLAQSGRERGASLFGNFAAGGLGTLTQGQFTAAGMDAKRRSDDVNAVLGAFGIK